MKIEETEKSLCRIYRNTSENQKLNIHHQNSRQKVKERIENLNRQWPYDMERMCKEYEI